MNFGVYENCELGSEVDIDELRADSGRYIMLLPNPSTINQVFSCRHPPTAAKSQESTPKPLQSRPARPQFSIWSVAEDAKSKANALSAEAQRELQKASAAAQAKTGQIELYSAKFYGVATFGGLIACVGIAETPASGLVTHECGRV